MSRDFDVSNYRAALVHYNSLPKVVAYSGNQLAQSQDEREAALNREAVAMSQETEAQGEDSRIVPDLPEENETPAAEAEVAVAGDKPKDAAATEPAPAVPRDVPEEIKVGTKIKYTCLKCKAEFMFCASENDGTPVFRCGSCGHLQVLEKGLCDGCREGREGSPCEFKGCPRNREDAYAKEQGAQQPQADKLPLSMTSEQASKVLSDMKDQPTCSKCALPREAYPVDSGDMIYCRKTSSCISYFAKCARKLMYPENKDGPRACDGRVFVLSDDSRLACADCKEWYEINFPADEMNKGQLLASQNRSKQASLRAEEYYEKKHAETPKEKEKENGKEEKAQAQATQSLFTHSQVKQIEEDMTQEGDGDAGASAQENGTKHKRLKRIQTEDANVLDPPSPAPAAAPAPPAAPKAAEGRGGGFDCDIVLSVVSHPSDRDPILFAYIDADEERLDPLVRILTKDYTVSRRSAVDLSPKEAKELQEILAKRLCLFAPKRLAALEEEKILAKKFPDYDKDGRVLSLTPLPPVCNTARARSLVFVVPERFPLWFGPLYTNIWKENEKSAKERACMKNGCPVCEKKFVGEDRPYASIQAMAPGMAPTIGSNPVCPGPSDEMVSVVKAMNSASRSVYAKVVACLAKPPEKKVEAKPAPKKNTGKRKKA